VNLDFGYLLQKLLAGDFAGSKKSRGKMKPRNRKIVFGMNKKFIAIRKASEGEKGYILQAGGKNSSSLICSATAFIRTAGVQGHIELTWDGHMLVGRRPGDE